MTEPSPPSSDIGFMNKGRLENLSDGIFAIILTLLVLELKVPPLADGNSPEQLGSKLLEMAPKFLSWANSFFTVSVIWLNHHRFFKMFRIVDHTLFWWNVVLLFWISLIPFPTALMGDYLANPLSVSFYGLVMFLQSVTWVIGRLYLHRHLNLFHEFVSVAEFRKGTLFTLLFGPVAYGAASALAWVHPYLAVTLYLVIAGYFILPHSTKNN